MKVEIFGTPGDWSVRVENGNVVEGRPELKPCPFCGADGEELEVCNTHSPSYWIDCLSCGGSIHPGPPSSYNGGRIRSKAKALALHEDALQKVVDVWNTRYPGPAST